jgi:membrane-associated phospholipid phosphatase
MKHTHGVGRLLSELTIGVLGILGCTTCIADDETAHGVLTDAKLYFTAPLHWDKGDWTYFGASLLAIGVAHEFDDDVRAHFVGGSHAAAPGQDPKSAEHALPTALLLGGTLTAALLTNNHKGYEETWSMVEAGAFSGIAALSLKYAFGRERPNDTAEVDAWFSSGDSFPSMHTTLAFSIGTVFAESGNDRYRWVRRIVGYGVAGGTAYLRLRSNVHWLSDTVAGASLGMSSAQFVMNRRHADHLRASLQVVPIGDGLMLTYSGPLH